MNVQDRYAVLAVRQIDGDMAVKAAGSEQGGIQHIRPVGRRQYNDSFMAGKAIHFGKDLVEGLLALIVAATKAGAARATHAVQFVDKDNARRVLFGFFEKVSDARSTHPHKHLDKL